MACARAGGKLLTDVGNQSLPLPPPLYFAAHPCNRHRRHSYAFAVAGSLADRACIADARKGRTPSPIKFSPQDMLSCGTVKHGKICVTDAEVCMYVCVCVCVCVCVW